MRSSLALLITLPVFGWTILACPPRTAGNPRELIARRAAAAALRGLAVLLCLAGLAGCRPDACLQTRKLGLAQRCACTGVCTELEADLVERLRTGWTPRATSAPGRRIEMPAPGEELIVLETGAAVLLVPPTRGWFQATLDTIDRQGLRKPLIGLCLLIAIGVTAAELARRRRQKGGHHA